MSKQANVVRRVPSEETKFWRNKPIRIPGAVFFVSEWLELIYGKIVLADQRVDNASGLLAYAAAFANHEETQFLPRVALSDDEAKLKVIEQEIDEKRLEERREELRTLLRSAVNGPSGPDDPDFENQPEDFLQRTLERTTNRIEWIASLDRNAGWHISGVVWESEGFMAVLTGVLLDKDNRDLLGQCRNDKCSRFFIVGQGPGDKPRKLYCCDDCMLAVNAAGNTARKRDSDKRQRATKILMGKWRGRRPSEDKIKAAIKDAFKNDPGASAEQLAKYATTRLQSKRIKK